MGREVNLDHRKLDAPDDADAWHQIEVGQPLEDELGATSTQVTIHHDHGCPSNTYWNLPDIVAHPVTCKIKFHDELGFEVTEYKCQIGSDIEFMGETYFIVHTLGITYGLWRVRGWFQTDRWGEGDSEYQVERLQGPVDERNFEGELI